jgi:uncharacterized damage-inducible protein DinB
MEWADATMWSCLHSCQPAKDDAKLRGLIYHTHAAQRAFLSIWKGEELDLAKADQFDDVIALEKWARDFYGELTQFLETLDPKRLDQEIAIPWGSGFEEKFGQKPAALTLGDTMMQSVVHSTHHRGQVNAYIRALEAEPSTVDYILWAWLGKPAPDWLP